MFDDILSKNSKLKDDVCPFCYSGDIKKNGDPEKTQYGWIVSSTKQPMRCENCGKMWVFVYDWTQKLVNIL